MLEIISGGSHQNLDLTRSLGHFLGHASNAALGPSVALGVHSEKTMKSARAFLAALAFGGALAHAEPAVVESVQYPAWLERGGNAVPLAPGTQLQAQDRLRTGTDARVQLRLGEGSTVKLGENARFVIETADDRGIFRAALAGLDGAVPFTPDPVGKAKRRDVR